MAIRVAINGFGRIGRNVFRILETDNDVEVVAINDLGDAKSLAHLLRYDSVHGRFNGEVEVQDGAMVVNGRTVKVTAERDPAALPWKDLKVDVAVEATGIFADRAGCQKHIDAGADQFGSHALRAVRC